MTEEQVGVKNDGVIYFSVTSDGTTGQQWIERLESKAFRISKWAKDVLNSPDFKTTTGVTTEVAVLPGVISKDDNRIIKEIRAEAERRNLLAPNAEVACLIREKLSDKELEAMGLWWIVIFHEPIKDSDGAPYLLAVSRYGDGPWLDTNYDNSDNSWNSNNGFAFAVSQLSLFLSLFGRVLFNNLSCPAA